MINFLPTRFTYIFTVNEFKERIVYRNMGTPLKNVSKLLSPRVLSPISPTFLNVRNNQFIQKEARKTPIAKRIEFSNADANFNHVLPLIKINITPNRCKDTEKHDILINTPNKKNIIKNGIANETFCNILGRGSFGKVFKATHKGCPVAMKLLKKSNSLRENNALTLSHNNIVTTLEIFENEHEHYSLILMEYLPNCGTLQNVLNSTSVCFEDALKYACDITDGLSYCHSKNVLHLDIKPANILVFNGTCKICDFGNSVQISEDMSTFEHHGTVQYTSPEILLGKKPTTKSDVYSLGITFWQLKARKCPYADVDNIECIIYKVVKCKLRPEVEPPNDAFSVLYHHCWSQEPLERPDASDVLQELNRIRC